MMITMITHVNIVPQDLKMFSTVCSADIREQKQAQKSTEGVVVRCLRGKPLAQIRLSCTKTPGCRELSAKSHHLLRNSLLWPFKEPIIVLLCGKCEPLTKSSEVADFFNFFLYSRPSAFPSALDKQRRHIFSLSTAVAPLQIFYKDAVRSGWQTAKGDDDDGDKMNRSRENQRTSTFVTCESLPRTLRMCLCVWLDSDAGEGGARSLQAESLHYILFLPSHSISRRPPSSSAEVLQSATARHPRATPPAEGRRLCARPTSLSPLEPLLVITSVRRINRQHVEP